MTKHELTEDKVSPELIEAFGKEVLLPYLQSIYEFASNNEAARELGMRSLVMFVVTNTVTNCFHNFTAFEDVKEKLSAYQDYIDALMFNCKMHFMDSV